MGESRPYLKLFSVRCTLLMFHALVWSFLWQSDPEFVAASANKETASDDLNTVRIVGAAFLGVIALFTITGVSVRSVVVHSVFILVHSLGIFLTLVAIFNYWDVNTLWVPVSICHIFPTFVQLVVLSFKAFGFCYFL